MNVYVLSYQNQVIGVFSSQLKAECAIANIENDSVDKSSRADYSIECMEVGA